MLFNGGSTLKYLFLAWIFAFSCNPAFAMQSVSYQGDTATTYQLIADFTTVTLKYRNIQVLNPDGFPIECAASGAVDADKVLIIPNKFTSITLQNFYPRGKLYCRCTQGSGPHTLTVHTWGLQ
jgi:hypothetical protein